jgi:hypothetical protein
MTKTNIDIDHIHNAFMAALDGIAAGKTREDAIKIPPLGTTTTIFAALNEAVKHLKEPFHAEHLDLVDRALKKLSLERRSNQKDEVARAILQVMVPR